MCVPAAVPSTGDSSFYRQLFEKSDAVQLLIDPTSSEICDANPAACACYGYAREVLIGMRISAINTLSREEIQAEMERARNEERRSFRFEHRLASGEVRHVEVYSSPVRSRYGEVLHSIIHDVTAHVEAEARLRAVNAQLQLLVSQTERVASGLMSDLQIAEVVSVELSNREEEVLTLIGQGQSTKAIAETLHLDDSTTRTYERRLRDKLGLKTRAALVRYAVERGLLA